MQGHLKLTERGRAGTGRPCGYLWHFRNHKNTQDIVNQQLNLLITIINSNRHRESMKRYRLTLSPSIYISSPQCFSSIIDKRYGFRKLARVKTCNYCDFSSPFSTESARLDSRLIN